MEEVQIYYANNLSVNLPEGYKQHLTEVAEKRGLSRSALIRKWLAAGERAEEAMIPDFDDPQSSGVTVQGDPVEQLFRAELPDSSNDAVSIDELRERMKERIDTEVMKLYRELDDLGVTEGGEVYNANEQ